MTTVYRPGDELFECCTYVGEGYRASPIVRTRTVLSVVTDPLYLDEHGVPVQVVTLRAFTPKRALYLAEIATYLDIKVEDGPWHRTDAEARAALHEAVGGIVGHDGMTPRKSDR